MRSNMVQVPDIRRIYYSDIWEYDVPRWDYQKDDRDDALSVV